MPRKPTHEEIGRKHGLHRVTISRYAQQGVDIYDDEAIKRHRNETGLDDQIKEAVLAKHLLEIEKIELYIEVTNANYYPKEEVEQGFAHTGAAWSACFKAMVSEFPALMVGMGSEVEIEAECKKFAGKWLAEHQDIKSATHKTAHETIIRDLRGDQKKVAAKQNRARKG